MLEIDVTAVELDAIIGIAVNLNVVHLCTTADTYERDAVNLVSSRKLVASLSHDYITQHSAAITGIVAARKS